MFNAPWIEGVSFGDVDIYVKGKIEMGNVDIGAVTLENNGRKFMLDVSSYRSHHHDGLPRHRSSSKKWGGYLDGTIISCDLEVDTDTFPEEEFKYDLTKQDLLDMGVGPVSGCRINGNHGGTGTIFVSTEDELSIDKIELWATVDDNEGKSVLCVHLEVEG